MEMPPNYYFLKNKKTAIKQVQITKNKPQKRHPPPPPQKNNPKPHKKQRNKKFICSPFDKNPHGSSAINSHTNIIYR